MMALFQHTTTCIQCMHMNKQIRLVPNVPRAAAPTWATGQMAAKECVVILATAGGGCVATAVFTKAVWTTMSAVQNTDIGALLVSFRLVSAAQAIPAGSMMNFWL